MAATASTFAETFADLLNVKHSATAYRFSVNPGRKYDKIVQTHGGNSRSVHAFVERATGHVFKAEGWAKPAAGVRFSTVEAAAEASDVYGGYLYAR